jgi:hypothetical protein
MQTPKKYKSLYIGKIGEAIANAKNTFIII